MHSYRVSKFDPNAPAADQRREWTSITDVGGRFFGETLTLEIYERVESKYLEALRLMFGEVGVNGFHVTDVVRASIASSESEWVANDTTVDAGSALSIVRAQLRGELSCHLVADNGFGVHIGFDLYVYVTSPTPLSRSLEQIDSLGLHVEHGVPSPYFSPGEH